MHRITQAETVHSPSSWLKSCCGDWSLVVDMSRSLFVNTTINFTAQPVASFRLEQRNQTKETISNLHNGYEQDTLALNATLEPTGSYEIAEHQLQWLRQSRAILSLCEPITTIEHVHIGPFSAIARAQLS